MSNPVHHFIGSVPTNYHRYMVPLIFEPYAKDLAARIEVLSPNAILETAAGTGVVTAELARSLAPGDTLLVTDFNLAMLVIAKQSITIPGVSFQQADATAMLFADKSFDAVVCQFGVMFFPDKLKGFKEAYRVLRKGGAFIFNVWDKMEFNEIAELVNGTLAKLFPENPPTFMASTPHGYNDIESIVATLEAAGFTNIKSETVQKRSRAATAREAALGYCQGTPMRSEIEARDATKLELATDPAEKAIIEKFGKGPIDAAMQAIVFTAIRA